MQLILNFFLLHQLFRIHRGLSYRLSYLSYHHLALMSYLVIGFRLSSLDVSLQEGY